MPSPEFERLLRAMRARPLTLEDATIAEQRARFESMALAAEPDIDVIDERIGDISTEILVPPSAIADRSILYLHGGGYFMGSPKTHRRLASEIGRACRAKVWVPEYPLAPENPFPAALLAVTSIYRALLQDHDGKNILLAGDSAGGGLALGTLVELRSQQVQRPGGAALLSPWVDMIRSEPYRPDLVSADPIVTPQSLDASRRWYEGDEGADRPLMSPVHEDLGGLPPLLVHVGSAEILLDDSRMLRAAAEESNLDVTYREWPGMTHVFHAFAGTVPEATEAVKQIGHFADHVLGPVSPTAPDGRFARH